MQKQVVDLGDSDICRDRKSAVYSAWSPGRKEPPKKGKKFLKNY